MTVHAANPAKRGIPLPTDWTHSHVIFSQPANADEARIVGEAPRYWQQRHHREQLLALISDPERSGLQFQDEAHQINGDWSQNLGRGASPGRRENGWLHK